MHTVTIQWPCWGNRCTGCIGLWTRGSDEKQKRRAVSPMCGNTRARPIHAFMLNHIVCRIWQRSCLCFLDSGCESHFNPLLLLLLLLLLVQWTNPQCPYKQTDNTATFCPIQSPCPIQIHTSLSALPCAFWCAFDSLFWPQAEDSHSLFKTASFCSYLNT